MNLPLTPVDQAKVFFFWIGLILLIGAGGAGILLILVTLWGLHRMRNTLDFSYIETVFIIHKGFASIASIVMLVVLLANWNKFYDSEKILIIPIIFIYPVYSFLVNWLFYAPLSRHKEWVVTNGIFSTTEAKEKKPRTIPLITLPSFSFKSSSNLSVADELIKLNNLKEAKLLTQDEFDKLRKNLLS